MTTGRKNISKNFWEGNEIFLKQLSQKILFAKKDKPTFFISICGAAATGKSTLAKTLAKYLEANKKNITVNILPLDAFMFDRTDRAKYNLTGYDPKAHYIDKVVGCIDNLRQGKVITYKPYSHLTGHYSNRNAKLQPSDIIIFEGIHSFHKNILVKVDCAIFIDGEKEVLKELRFNADVHERKYRPSDAFHHSEPEYKNFEKFILPYRKAADMVIKVQLNWQYSIPK